MPRGVYVRTPRPRPVWDRFWAHVDASGDCWEWTGHLTNGYGRFRRSDRSQPMAHRVAWELLVGPIPGDMQIDHRCLNRKCVNPDHLEVVTGLENVRRTRGPSAPRVAAAKTHCLRGHEFTPQNTNSFKDGRRRCRTCKLARDNQSENRASQTATRREWNKKNPDKVLEYNARRREKRRLPLEHYRLLDIPHVDGSSGPLDLALEAA